jgi:hypothetical protein
MDPQPVFPGRVLPGGLLVHDRPKDYAQYVRSLKGCFVETVVRKRRLTRTNPQNRYYFGVVVKLIADHCGYERDEMHELLAMKFLRMEDDPITGAPRRKRTPKTDTQEFMEYVEACVRFGAELGVYVPDPNEVTT